MKYKWKDKVRIKSKKELECISEVTDDMLKNGGAIMTIACLVEDADGYIMKEDGDFHFLWTDEMIEGLVEAPKFKKGDCVKCSDGSCGIIVTCDWSDSLNCYQYYIDYIGTLDAGYQPEKDLQLHTITTMNGIDIFEGAKWKHEFECPDGYLFKDENGNVINATKIVLEKKKKQYPKTYEECAEVLGECAIMTHGYKRDVLNALQKLIVCRDAYWKIAGEEMGLDEPWEPDWTYNGATKYCIGVSENEIQSFSSSVAQYIFAFPTEEMRDAFKENFDPDLEICKEFL